MGLVEPPPTGYLHLAAVIEPPLGQTPFPRGSQRKTELLSRLRLLAGQVERLEAVLKATVYRAILIPPSGRDARQQALHPARYDVVVLVETASTDMLDNVQATLAYRELLAVITDAAREVHVMAARCVRRVDDVDKTRQGLFLFNYFVAEDVEVALQVWDHLAAWYVVETGLDNSMLLAPVGAADYVFVNHARWDCGLVRFAVRQFAKKSFRSYVLANLRANGTASMPIFYRLA